MTAPVVNFSELTTDKKQEFLHFLVENNIKFQEGAGDYIAKVTLKDTRRDKENRQPLSPVKKGPAAGKQQQQYTPASGKKSLTSTTNHQRQQQPKALQTIATFAHNNYGSDVKPSEKPTSPSKSKGKPHSGHTRQLTVTAYQNPPSQRASLPPPEHETRNVVRQQTRNRSKSASSRPRQIVQVMEPTKQVPRDQSSKSKVKINTSLQTIKAPLPYQQETNSQIATRQVSASHSIQSHQPQLQHSATTKPVQLYPPEHLNELLSILKVPVIAGRPTRLPRAQVLKLIEQLYSSNFAKNNQLLKHKKFKEAYYRGNCVFSSYVIEHFEERYKTQRLCHGNLLNLAHSILCYLNEPDPPSSLKMFYHFLLEDYEYQELVFFLFIRSVFEKEFGETMEKIVSHPSRLYHEHTLNRREVTRFIRAIFGRDSQQIVAEYQQLVFMQMGDTIPLYQVFTLMLVDYQCKRRIKQQNTQLSHVETNTTVSPTNHHFEEDELPKTRTHLRIQEVPTEQPSPNRQQPANQAKSSKCSLFHEGNSSNFEELTFGEYSASNRIEEEDETEFWNDFESLKAPDDDPMFKELEHKLKKKVAELVQIMLGDQQSLWTGPAKQLGRLILNKSLRMLEAIFAMDKIKWFRLLRVHRPQPQHLEVVETLQLLLRNMRRLQKSSDQDPDELRQLESEFCKSLLTVDQLKRAIERIVIG